MVARLPEGSVERREAVQVLGLASYLAGRIADAIPYLEQTRQWAEGNQELAYVLGMAYVQTRQPDKARATWARSFGVAEGTAAARLLTAQMMIRAELDEMADAELKQALALEPRLPRANLLLGQTALFRGRLDDAVALFKRELEINPGDAMALYRLGDAYARQNKWDEALATLQKSIWINPYFSGPYILLGKAYMRKSDLAAAEGMLRQAVGYDPNNKAAHYLLGQVLQQAGRADEARRELETPNASRAPRPLAMAFNAEDAEGRRGRRERGGTDGSFVPFLLCALAFVLCVLRAEGPGPAGPAWPVSPADVAEKAGLTAPSLRGRRPKRFIIETNGPAWPSSTTTTTAGTRSSRSGTRLQDGASPGAGLAGRPGARRTALHRNLHDGTFRDVTEAAGSAPHRLRFLGMRGRLRQRRALPRPVHHLLRPERPLPQPRRRAFEE